VNQPSATVFGKDEKMYSNIADYQRNAKSPRTMNINNKPPRSTKANVKRKQLQVAWHIFPRGTSCNRVSLLLRLYPLLLLLGHIYTAL
jgi:hypothetical protein